MKLKVATYRDGPKAGQTTEIPIGSKTHIEPGYVYKVVIEVVGKTAYYVLKLDK